MFFFFSFFLLGLCYWTTVPLWFRNKMYWRMINHWLWFGVHRLVYRLPTTCHTAVSVRSPSGWTCSFFLSSQTEMVLSFYSTWWSAGAIISIATQSFITMWLESRSHIWNENVAWPSQGEVHGLATSAVEWMQRVAARLLQQSLQDSCCSACFGQPVRGLKGHLVWFSL